ncbi:hypothetical protein LTR37_002490 [Vermiconidia calcicola]|uniref:Uncharacterized protein n=1 Tax=Vermiconidia calcicola TaxID=1690605 RepID=A0ACC3NTP1_9PEZI|nr:hypothetical protein LTR37_002490 [Vermiconidia calcicola]
MYLKRSLPFALAILNILDVTTAKPPNIVFIISDDQDARLGSLNYMEHVQKDIIGAGLDLSNHFGTVALCCPARATLLRGQAAHNTNITHVGGPGGGYPKFRRSGEMNDYLPHWLNKAGYTTAYIGKFMNGYGANSPPPLGWDIADILISPYIYAFNNVVMKRNGERPVHYKGFHQTDVLRVKAVDLLESFTADDAEQKPFYLEIAPVSPHVSGGGFPTTPQARHMHAFPGVVAPRTPNWNTADDELQQGKAAWVRDLPVMNKKVVEASDASFRARLQGLLGVDEIVEDVVALLAKKGLLEDTFIIYTTDNGFHLGQHRVPGGKGLPYIEDVNLPFAVRGPGIACGKVSTIPSTHVDIAPTLLDIAGLPRDQWPPFFDGRSLLPEWQNPEYYASENGNVDGIEREIINVEFWGSATAPAGKYTTHWEHNSYKSLRIVAQNGRQGWLFNRWCTGNQTELYDTVADPYELHNLALDPDVETKRLMDRLSALLLVTKSCGRESCRKPWEVLSEACAQSSVLASSNDFKTLDQAMDTRYDPFFESLPTFGFQMCLPYQLPSNEGPFFPAESEDLGREYRDAATEFAFWLNNGTFAVDTMSLHGDLGQRYMSFEDLSAGARDLTDEEIGWPSIECKAPDYCGTDDDD